MSYAPLTAENRCDRCGAQAYYVTAHTKSTLMWCAHHYREHEPVLAPDLIYIQPLTGTASTVEEAAPA